MILGDVVMLALYARVDNPTLREGQSLFNALAEIDSGLANAVTNTENDPYHQNENIDNFYQFIVNNS